MEGLGDGGLSRVVLARARRFWQKASLVDDLRGVGYVSALQTECYAENVV